MPNRDTSENVLPATLARLGLGKGTLPPGAETDKDRLVRALTSREWSVRAAATRALGKLGEQAPIERLVAALGDENDVVRAAAAHALGTLKGRAPIEPLVAALRDSAWRVRAAVALTLGQMGERAPIDELVDLVNDEDASVCAAAVQALGEVGERVPIETLVLALNDQDWSVREAAAMTLGNVGRRAPVGPLVAALRDKDSLVREAAAKALQRTHPERLSEITSTLEEEMVSSENKLEAIGTNHASDLMNRPTNILLQPAGIDSIPIASQRRLLPFQQQLLRRMVALAAAALVIASLIVASLALLPGLLSRPQNPPLAQSIGSVIFSNSLRDIIAQNDGSMGFNDELQINLHDINPPAAGKSYYAWLLSDKENPETTSIALGKLPFSKGKIHFLYKNPTQQNLLIITNYFLITEEDAHVTPLILIPDHSRWRYSAEISRIPNPADTLHHYSLFDHIQRLLAKDVVLESVGLHGGLGFWLTRNAGKVGEKAQNAQFYWQQHNAQQLRNQLIGILDYLDGVPYVNNDVPPGTPLQDPKAYTDIGLLSLDPQGYLQHIESHLNAIVQHPDASADQKALATQLIEEINRINAQCEMVHQDARSLINMTNAQLLQASSLSLLKAMAVHAEFAYSGNQQAQLEGAVKVFSDMQSLASLDVEAYKQ